MRRSLVVLTALAFPGVSLPSLAQSDHPDIITGPVTAVSPPAAFDVSGRHIVLSSSAHLCTRISSDFGAVTEQCNEHAGVAPEDLFIGEQVQLSGYDHPAKHSFAASKVTILPLAGSIGGAAIIDLVPAQQPSNSAEHIIRADGYLLRITPETKLKFEPPLASLADISTNQWIRYSGKQQDDGTVGIDSAVILPNRISATEEKLRKKTEYDPSKVPYVADQGDISKEFLKTYYKYISPWPNAAMQARVEHVGKSLVPAFQRALPDDDPAKINFRFQVIDENNLHDAMNLPSGVILVPHQIVERMQNDDQLATVLADSIAQVLEKDAIRIHPLAVAGTVGTVAEWATIPLPAANIAVNATSDAIRGGKTSMIDAQLAQSGRVSLCLLHDAGYNVQQAPLAWWLLAGKKGKPLDQVKLPSRAENLYNSIGFVWHNPVMNAAQPAPASDLSTAANSAPATHQN